jgi:hypothetical protein
MRLLSLMWIAATVVLLVSIGESAAQPKSGETVAQKIVVVLHSYDRNFEPRAVWSKEIRHQLGRQSPWPLKIQEQSLATAHQGA